MYLVSLYFDNKSISKIQGFINKVADRCGNNFMIDNNVPPHITIAAFQSDKEESVVEVLNNVIKNSEEGLITCASIGSFKSSVIFLAPILNEYLHNLSVNIHEGIASIDDVSISKYYLPFQWIPHITIGKKLTKEELILAFEELDKNFSIFNGKVTKIALSKTNPLKDIVTWNLDN